MARCVKLAQVGMQHEKAISIELDLEMPKCTCQGQPHGREVEESYQGLPGLDTLDLMWQMDWACMG